MKFSLLDIPVIFGLVLRFILFSSFLAFPPFSFGAGFSKRRLRLIEKEKFLHG
jgi:hypothetical protein